MAANKNISAAPAAEAVEAEAPAMFKVKLNKVVSLHGFTFRPGLDNIVVNKATLDAMGDAVEDVQPV